MAGPAKRSLWLFVAGCVLFAIGIGLLWSFPFWGMHQDRGTLSYRGLVALSVFTIICGPLLMLAGCIYFCIVGEPEKLRRRGRWLAIGSLLYIFATSPFVNFHSESAFLVLPVVLLAFLACLMASAGWIRSRLQHK